MIEEDLPRATAALLDGDVAVPPILAEHQQQTDALLPQLETIASRAILREAPVACDLRFLLSVLRVAPEFEQAYRLVAQITAPAGLLDARYDEMDDLYQALIAELAAGLLPVPATIELTLVARCYERLAGHLAG